MTKALRDIKEFYDFTDVYDNITSVWNPRNRILSFFNALVEEQVTEVTLRYVLNPLLEFVEVKYFKDDAECDGIDSIYSKELPEEFTRYAARKYHPKCGANWGGEWFCHIRFNYSTELKVEVTHRCSKNTVSSVTAHMSTFRVE